MERAIAEPWLLPSGFFGHRHLCRHVQPLVGSAGDGATRNLPKINAFAATLSQRPAVAPVWKKHFGS